MKTKSAKAETVVRRWYVVDANDKVLGRLATWVASVLRGKHKPDFTPHVDTGDFVVVVNARKVRLTGPKEQKKVYYHHTNWQGHIKERTAAEVRQKRPTDLIRFAVKGMLPRGPLGRAMFSKLKVYAGPEHPHAAQKPESLSL